MTCKLRNEAADVTLPIGTKKTFASLGKGIRSPEQGFATLTLVLSLGALLSCLAVGYWLGYSHRDAVCKEAKTKNELIAIENVIKQNLKVSEIYKKIDEQTEQLQADNIKIQTLIDKSEKQNHLFWRKQRDENKSCDVWMRAVVPCRLQPTTNDGATATSGVH
ncbi:hypothetical protein UFOVP1082_34 [uncultured Caudovirales phage]|uniref:Uncharacterized protein n=1 Tax=uncultured Caudovirales phage TaxID=2100421 RepID=A0A6J5RJ03_9CAUD|nr:hypothetical protein UFOVP906_12 [uncultured Caudovirales phage]CAB4176518.1 hypothetical protein UFOVP992_38 [uncultured Caudovirales phage]CAB4183373.1 hypothetical protein UFOVP1082_34 [uncultured Caudovirales phage]CAB4197383.1 hypothetical protein UFOVP1322_19 [uncultured Caudovirales phage]CAB4212769.1 hypothetical protein UFOVP1434_41 [uncultured Caudovirales phage]